VHELHGANLQSSRPASSTASAKTNCKICAG
jgi:hypothetical protein